MVKKNSVADSGMGSAQAAEPAQPPPLSLHKASVKTGSAANVMNMATVRNAEFGRSASSSSSKPGDGSFAAEKTNMTMNMLKQLPTAQNRMHEGELDKLIGRNDWAPRYLIITQEKVVISKVGGGYEIDHIPLHEVLVVSKPLADEQQRVWRNKSFKRTNSKQRKLSTFSEVVDSVFTSRKPAKTAQEKDRAAEAAVCSANQKPLDEQLPDPITHSPAQLRKNPKTRSRKQYRPSFQKSGGPAREISAKAVHSTIPSTQIRSLVTNLSHWSSLLILRRYTGTWLPKLRVISSFDTRNIDPFALHPISYHRCFV